MHLGTDQQTGRVGDEVTLAAFDFASKPRGPPASVVLTDWLSMTPAEGLGSRPTISRACNNSSKLIRSNTPLSRQA
jgi:hypothetical protein